MIQTILKRAKTYVGTVQGDSRHKDIIDKYNAVKPLPVGYKMKYTDDWCAAFITVLGDQSGASALIGRECGVHRFTQIFKKKGIWLGLKKPKVGDIVVFDWQKNGWNDHIGIVEKVNGNQITTIEGNTKRLVATRVYPYNDWRIAGYARPKYKSNSSTNPQKHLSIESITREVIAGKWGNGDVRKTRLAQAGLDPAVVQQSVNRLIKEKSAPTKSNSTIAKEVIQGKWGNGEARRTKLTQAGYNYQNIQKLVNQLV